MNGDFNKGGSSEDEKLTNRVSDLNPGWLVTVLEIPVAPGTLISSSEKFVYS
jgi:hypothetical protein